MIAQVLVEWHKYSVELACQLVDLPRSSFYYKSRKAVESYLEGNLKTVTGQFPTYGSRRITHQLRRSPYWYHFNRKRIQRLMHKLNLLQPVKRIKWRMTNSDHPYPRYPNLAKGLVVAAPEQVCGLGYHVHSPGRRVRLLGHRDGCLHPCHSWLASLEIARPGADLGSAEDGPDGPSPTDASQ